MFAYNGQVNPSVERRRTQRIRVLKQAYIIFNNRRSTLTCRIRDISSDGCRLKLANTSMVPEEFIIYFPTDGRERPCRVAWRGLGQLGVKFLDTPA